MFQLAHGAAVRVLEHPEHAFHAGADAVADGFGRDDVDDLRSHVVDEQFAYPHELLHFFAEFPDVVLDAGYEVCLDRVPVPAKPVWRHFREIGPFVLCFHAYGIA